MSGRVSRVTYLSLLVSLFVGFENVANADTYQCVVKDRGITCDGVFSTGQHPSCKQLQNGEDDFTLDINLTKKTVQRYGWFADRSEVPTLQYIQIGSGIHFSEPHDSELARKYGESSYTPTLAGTQYRFDLDSGKVLFGTVMVSVPDPQYEDALYKKRFPSNATRGYMGVGSGICIKQKL